jgi:hypothetical protein
MTRQEVVEKALDLIGPILGKERGNNLVAKLVGIDKVDDILALRPLLQAG